jgi:hypothetical protein
MSPERPSAGENRSEPLTKNQNRLRLARKIAARRRAQAEMLTPSEIEQLRQEQSAQVALLQNEFRKARLAP